MLSPRPRLIVVIPQNSWTELRRYPLPPRIFQFFVNRYRAERTVCSGLKLSASLNESISPQAPTRCFSALHPSRAAVRVSAGNEKQKQEQKQRQKQNTPHVQADPNIRSNASAHRSGTSLPGKSKPIHRRSHYAPSERHKAPDTVRSADGKHRGEGGAPCLASRAPPAGRGDTSHLASPLPPVDGFKTQSHLLNGVKWSIATSLPGHGSSDQRTPLSRNNASTLSLAKAAAVDKEALAHSRATDEICESHNVAMKGISPAASQEEEKNSAISATRRRMRHFMRRVPQPAAIITSTETTDLKNPWRGATVSSFTTVTLEPEVIISLNLKLPSSTFAAIQTSKVFDVNMLKPTPEGAELASQFARGHAASPFGNAHKNVFVRTGKGRKGVDQSRPPSLFRGRGEVEPVAFSLSCVYMPEKTVYLGDHAVIFGTVNAAPIPAFDWTTDPSTTCLAYVDGCYGQVLPLPTTSVGGPRNETDEASASINTKA